MEIAGFASGPAPVLTAIADRSPGGAELALVVADDPDGPALEAAERRGIETAAVDPDAAAYGAALSAVLDRHDVSLAFVDGFGADLAVESGSPPRTLSWAPALYPAFRDAEDPVAAALEAGVAVTGATVHEVGPGTDADAGDGRILAQEPVAVGGADRETLAARVETAGVRATLRALRSIAGEAPEGAARGSGPDGTPDGSDPDDEGAGRFPGHYLASADHEGALRYGENPHQSAAVYAEPTDGPSVVGAPQLNEGAKALSYNNYNDADGALALVREFDRPAAVVVKHTNPAGCATADSVAAAYDRALSTDPMSAFGGVVALNRECDRETATAITDSFKEVVVAPGYTDGALSVLREEANLRVLSVGAVAPPSGDPPLVETALAGGRLVQERDEWAPDESDLEVVTEREPIPEEVESLLFAWRVVKHVKSNAICFATGTETVGIGAGQMSRVDAVEIAARKAEEHAEGKSAEGAVMASDAFFPFPDGVEAAAEAGVEAVIQPGGSVNDEDVIDAADELGMAMVLTGHRAFRHD